MARIPTQPTTESGLPALVPHGRFKGKPVMHLGRPVTVIGARARSHLHLVSPSVSKSHAMVVNTGAGFYVRDLASRTHIYLNGQQVTEAELSDGDILGVGPFTFRFTDPGRSSSATRVTLQPGVLRASNSALPIALHDRVTIIGRRPTCDVAIDEAEVSTTHAVVFDMNGKRFIRDLGSRTGTFINGTAIHQQPLELGDRIRIGSVDMVYAAADDLAGVGTELPDETDDLAGTAHLPAQEAADVPFAGAAARAGGAAPRFADVVTNDNGHALGRAEPVDESDLAMEPASGVDGNGALPLATEPSLAEPLAPELSLAEPPKPGPSLAEPPAPPATVEPVDELMVTPLLPEPESLVSAPAAPEVPAAAAGPSTAEDSSVGIELLPHDEAAPAVPPFAAQPPAVETADVAAPDVSAEPTADHAPTPAPAGVTAPAEPDFGLEFHEPAQPIPSAAAAVPQAPAAPEAVEGADFPVDLQPVDLDELEVVEKTEPTPESAIALDDVLTPDDSVAGKAASPAAPAADAMTDSVFGREVEAFEGPGLGPLVEAGPSDDLEPPFVLDALAEEESSPAPSDPLIYEEPSAAAAESADVSESAPEQAEGPPELTEPTGEAPAVETGPAKRRGGRKPAAPKAAKKPPAAPKRKAPARKSPKAAAAEAAAAGTAAGAATAGPAEAIPAAEVPTDDSVSAGTLAEASVELEAAPAPDVAPEEVVAGLAPVAPPAEVPVVAEPPVGITPESAADVASEPPVVVADSAAPAVAVDDAIEPAPPAVAERAEPVVAAEPPALDAPVVSDAPAAPVEVPLGLAEEPQGAAVAAKPGTIDFTAPAAGQLVPPATPAALAVAEHLVLADPLAPGDDEPVDLEIDLAPRSMPAAAEAAPLAPYEPPAASAEMDAGGAGAPPEATAADLGEPTGDVATDAVAEEGAPAKPADLFFGLERDTASFLGGMPLQLPPLQSPFAPQTRVDFTRPPGAAAGAPQPADIGDDDDVLEIDDSAPDLEPDPYPDDATASAEAAAGLDLHDEVVPPSSPAAAAPVSPFRPAPPPPARSGPGGRERGARPAAAPAPAAKRPLAASSPFDLNFEDVPTDRIEIPPFSGPGPATRGQVTTAFDGLAMPPVREADVFSQRPVGETEIPPFAGPTAAGAGAAPGAPADARKSDEAVADDEFGDEDQEPLDLSTAEDDLGDVPLLDDPDADRAGAAAAAAAAGEARQGDDAPGESRKPWQPVGASRRPPAYPAEPAGGRPAPPKKKKKRWRIGKWGLFSLMLVTMGVAALAIWYAWPAPTATVTGRIHFDKLEKLTEAQRQQVLAEQRTRIQKPEVRASAREILANNFGGIAPGFLAERGSEGDVKAVAAAFMKLTESLQLVEKQPVIFVKHQAVDGEGDQRRVRALLHALYAENKPFIDKAGELARALKDKESELQEARIEFRALEPAMAEARQQLGGDRGAVKEKQALVDALQLKEKQLSEAWNKTTSRVKQMTADALAAESAMPFDPDADPAKTPVAADEDPQAVEMARRAEELSKQLAAAKVRRTARAEQAGKVMAAALKQFEDDIAKARAEMKPDTELGRYLDAAARVQSQLKIVSGELAQQQRSDMERLGMLKQKLAEKNEARIRQAFAGDAELQSMQEQLALKERQYNTARGGGLRDDARSLEQEVKALRLEIESRQDLLTTADGVAPDMKDLETFIGETLGRMEKDRARNDRIMAEHLKELASKAPAAGSLPAEQKAFAEQLERRQAELNKAREGYAAAVEAAAAEADEEVKDVETELAAVQAKLDERKKQVAEAARKSLSADQQRERVAITDASRRKLDQAQKADEDAAAKYLANRRALADAELQLEQARRRTQSFDRESQAAVAAQRRIAELGEEVEQLKAQVDSSIVPVKPADEHVALAPQPEDKRLTYTLATWLVLVLAFVPFIARSPLHPALADDAEDGDPAFAGHDGAHASGDGDGTAVPFAAPVARHGDGASLAAARAAESATEQEQARHDESPLPV